MVLQIVVQKFKSLLLLIIGVFRRALCCFRRKRLNSEDCIPLTTIGVVPNNGYNETDNWNSWDDKSENQKPNSIQQHIDMYRQQTLLARQKSVEKTEERTENENFFEDMTPRITRQTKIFLNKGDNNETNGSRLNFNPQGIIVAESELGEWEESQGWEEQTQSDLNPQDVIREKRRQERERRLWEQQQKKQEKYNRPLGAKIS